MTRQSSIPPISDENITAVLEFLPLFESEGFHAYEGMHDGYYRWTDGLDRFHTALYDNMWVVDFDWPAWQHDAAAILDDPAALANAGMETLRKLLTTLARQEYFCANTFPIACNDGHLTRILRRLKALHELQLQTQEPMHDPAQMAHL